MSQAEVPSSTAESLGKTAARGGMFTAVQVVANKALSMVGMLAVTYLLAPEQVGVAGVALSIQSLVMVMPAFTLSDVLIAQPGRVRSNLPRALRICAAISAPMVAALVAWGLWKSGHGGPADYLRAGFIVAFQPIVDLMLLGPQTRLRAELAFARIARVDTVCYAASTLLTVAMAATDFGSASILLPPIAMTAVRAGLYRLAERSPRSTGPSEQPTMCVRSMLRDYFLSGLGQYAHYGLIMSTPLVLDALYGERIVGLFRNAFLLSAVINSVVATGIGVVLQPIFAHMQHDPVRQSQAFVRSCTVIAVVSMPACLAQAILIGPALQLLLPAGWAAAGPMAAVMSAGQALYFAVNPAMALLKAQGRFRAFLAWQSAQFVGVTALMLWVGKSGFGGALAVIAVYGLYHAVSSPVGIALSVRGGGLAGEAVRSIIVRPLLAAAVGVAPLLALRFALGSMLPTTWSHVVLLAAAPLVALPACFWAMRRLCPAPFAECLRLALPLTGRLGVRWIGQPPASSPEAR